MAHQSPDGVVIKICLVIIIQPLIIFQSFISWWTYESFPLLAIINSTPVNICAQFLACTDIFNSLQLYLGMKLLGYMVTPCLQFKCFPWVVAAFYIPAMYESSNFSTGSVILVIVCLCYYSHPSGYKVAFYYANKFAI